MKKKFACTYIPQNTQNLFSQIRALAFTYCMEDREFTREQGLNEWQDDWLNNTAIGNAENTLNTGSIIDHLSPI